MRSECAHKAEHTLQKHVKESVKLLLTLGFLQHKEPGKGESVLQEKKVQFVSIKGALSLKKEKKAEMLSWEREVVWELGSQHIF